MNPCASRRLASRSTEARRSPCSQRDRDPSEPSGSRRLRGERIPAKNAISAKEAHVSYPTLYPIERQCSGKLNGQERISGNQIAIPCSGRENFGKAYNPNLDDWFCSTGWLRLCADAAASSADGAGLHRWRPEPGA